MSITHTWSVVDTKEKDGALAEVNYLLVTTNTETSNTLEEKASVFTDLYPDNQPTDTTESGLVAWGKEVDGSTFESIEISSAARV